MKKDTEILALVEELQTAISLDTVDAHRSAFVVFALRRNWTKARIGRYLGVSRARVHQRVQKLESYAENKKEFPILHRLMKPPKKKPPVLNGGNEVAFDPESWEDEEFAIGMLERVA